MEHKPVLVNEILEIFKRLDKGIIVDCTLGLGGHSKELAKNFKIIGVDRDEKAIEKAGENLKEYKNIIYVHDNFVHLRKILDKLKIKEADGILLDLGVSSYQLEDEKRGFGFSGKLDMREDSSQDLTAEKIVNEYSEEELARILYEYGEKVFARAIARNIVEAREKVRIEKAEQLLGIIKSGMPPRYRFSRKGHWATPSFRALRIEVNKDIENLKIFLGSFLNCLRKEGIIAVISFHSIEDRIIKNKFKELAKEKKIELLMKKPVVAGEEEIKTNRKAKRAKLRAAKKI